METHPAAVAMASPAYLQSSYQILCVFAVLQAGYDLVEIPAFNADKLDGVFLQALSDMSGAFTI